MTIHISYSEAYLLFMAWRFWHHQSKYGWKKRTMRYIPDHLIVALLWPITLVYDIYSDWYWNAYSAKKARENGWDKYYP